MSKSEGTQEKGKVEKAPRDVGVGTLSTRLKRNDNLNLELCIRCGHASAETLSPDLHECLLCRICVSKPVF